MTSRLSKLALDPLSFPTIFWESTSPCPAYLQRRHKDMVSTSSTLMITMLQKDQH